MHDMNPHILNAMTMIAGAHRGLHFTWPLGSGDAERVKAKLVCALGDLAYFSKTEPHYDEQRVAARWPHRGRV